MISSKILLTPQFSKTPFPKKMQDIAESAALFGDFAWKHLQSVKNADMTRVPEFYISITSTREKKMGKY
jgi:hypothetical protein